MNLTQELVSAYLLTVFKVATPGGSISFSARGESTALAELHARHNVKSSAFLTAYNPFSQPTDAETNIRNQAELQTSIEGKWDFLTGEGADPTEVWPAEPSLLILGIGLDDALSLGRKFGQAALVFAAADGLTDLYACDPEDQAIIRDSY